MFNDSGRGKYVYIHLWFHNYRAKINLIEAQPLYARIYSVWPRAASVCRLGALHVVNCGWRYIIAALVVCSKRVRIYVVLGLSTLIARILVRERYIALCGA